MNGRSCGHIGSGHNDAQGSVIQEFELFHLSYDYCWRGLQSLGVWQKRRNADSTRIRACKPPTTPGNS